MQLRCISVESAMTEELRRYASVTPETVDEPAEDSVDEEEQESLGDDAESPGRVRLGSRWAVLEAPCPRPGDVLRADFRLQPAHHASTSLCASQLQHGLVILSTLPNIEKRACTAQILALDRELDARGWRPQVVHVSSDAARHWSQLARLHDQVNAAGYTVDGASDKDRQVFARSFGVAVSGERRIAHGLFALQDGVFLSAEVPENQFRTPGVRQFLQRLARLMTVLKTKKENLDGAQA